MEDKNNPTSNIFIQLLKGLCYFLLFLGTQTLSVLILMIAFGVREVIKAAANGQGITPDALAYVMEQKVQENNNVLMILYTFILLLFLAVFFAIRKKKFGAETGIRKFSPGYLPAIVLFSVGLTLFINAGLNLLPSSVLQDYSEASSFIGAGVFAVTFIADAICAPISEEIIFRGLMLSRFKKGLPRWLAILLTSLLFGLVHGQILWIAYAFFLGILLCMVVERTGSILASILVHAIFNALGTILAFSELALPATHWLYAICGMGFAITAAGTFLILRKKPSKQMTA